MNTSPFVFAAAAAAAETRFHCKLELEKAGS